MRPHPPFIDDVGLIYPSSHCYNRIAAPGVTQLSAITATAPRPINCHHEWRLTALPSCRLRSSQALGLLSLGSSLSSNAKNYPGVLVVHGPRQTTHRAQISRKKLIRDQIISPKKAILGVMIFR